MNPSTDLALSHQNRDGKDRPVGKIHGGIDLNAAGNNSKNYHSHGGVGAGTVVWRSQNKSHSVGVGAHAEQQRGKFQGHGYQSKPNYGAGVGYQYKF
ncbi:UNVERIFIED_CONTAM: hypothetical protein RMT77_006066 [Armadillidium vulgare]